MTGKIQDVARHVRTQRIVGLCLSLYVLSNVQYAEAQTTRFAMLYSFRGSPDGAEPIASITIGSSGALYGTTFSGGAFEKGAAFELRPVSGGNWSESVIYSFSGPDGTFPAANLTFGNPNLFYGTTKGGGLGAGTVFELARPQPGSTQWTEKVLYSFETGNRSQNHTPGGAVIIGPGKALYTTAEGQGGAPAGTADVVTPPANPGDPWTGSVIYSFEGSAGSQPFAGMIFSAGALFGTDYYSGDEFCVCGVVYELAPPVTAGAGWTESTIHTFTGSPDDGGGSEAPLVEGPGGVLYGTTFYGGAGSRSVCSFSTGVGCGTVFQLTPPTAPGGAWTESILYSFTGVNGDGAYPKGAVIISPSGIIYGTTEYGGSATEGSPCTFSAVVGCGTVFQLTPPSVPGGPWTETVLHSFSGQNGDGSLPVAGLALAANGALYGTTSTGGSSGKGGVFSIQP